MRATWHCQADGQGWLFFLIATACSSVVQCELPSAKLYTFDGAVADKNDVNVQPEPLTVDNLLLRGCTLRKTSWVVSLPSSIGLALCSVGNVQRVFLQHLMHVEC